MRQRTRSYLFVVSLLVFSSCNRNDFLEQNPDSNIFIPATLEDCQALLDNETAMNETPALGEVSADNYYLPSAFWNTLNVREKNAYIWNPATFEGIIGNIPDWNGPYKQVLHANVVFETLSQIPVVSYNEVKWKEIKGAALFARAHAFYQIAQLFAPVYTSNAPDRLPGIPLRLSANVDEKSTRASLKETYDQIIRDLLEASQLLPKEIPFLLRNRSSRPAAYALLARTYLSMSNYEKAGDYADSCLQLYNTLIRYDTLPGTNNNPFNKLNVETIFQSRFNSTTNVLKALSVSNCIVDSGLYNSYESDDLRKSTFFRVHPTLGNVNPKASYNGTNQLFTGIATDEVYLIRAECRARLGEIEGAMNDLNTLLRHRWVSSRFQPLQALDKEDAVAKILIERRKELPFRGLRWTDLRRLNQQGVNIVLKRRVNGTDYELKPGDLRYTLLIPPDVIGFTGMQQNPR